MVENIKDKNNLVKEDLQKLMKSYENYAKQIEELGKVKSPKKRFTEILNLFEAWNNNEKKVSSAISKDFSILNEKLFLTFIIKYASEYEASLKTSEQRSFERKLAENKVKER